MAKIIKNTTGSAIDIKSVGIILAASSQISVEPTDYPLLGSADVVTELTPLINSGDIVVNTGDEDLPAARAIEYIKIDNEADQIHFKNNGLVANNFVARDVQSAIEESFNQANAAIYPLSILHNGTVGNGTFFSYSNLTPGTPIIVPINSEFLGFTFSNSNANADYTLEFRNNSDVGATFEVVTKVNTQFFVDLLATPEPFNAGDFISIKYIDDGQNASDVAITLFFRAVA